ncbi:unnamed protein product [Heterobilharzia americana]|nr:unnamed protein product [Heterobilharzia americana]
MTAACEVFDCYSELGRKMQAFLVCVYAINEINYWLYDSKPISVAFVHSRYIFSKISYTFFSPEYFQFTIISSVGSTCIRLTECSTVSTNNCIEIHLIIFN